MNSSRLWRRGRRRQAARLRHFVDRGLLSRCPSHWQLRVGWKAALPVYLTESPRERERSRRTWLGQVPIRAPLQALYSPSHLRLVSGLTLPNRAIVRHLLCVYHEDAFLGYDLQLLEGLAGGLDDLARAATRVVESSSLRARLLRDLVGGPGYHERLAALAEAARRGDYPSPRDLDPRFATLVGFAEFCNSLPDWPALDFYGFERERIRP